MIHISDAINVTIKKIKPPMFFVHVQPFLLSGRTLLWKEKGKNLDVHFIFLRYPVP